MGLTLFFMFSVGFLPPYGNRFALLLFRLGLALLLEPSAVSRCWCCCYFLLVQHGLHPLNTWCKCLVKWWCLHHQCVPTESLTLVSSASPTRGIDPWFSWTLICCIKFLDFTDEFTRTCIDSAKLHMIEAFMPSHSSISYRDTREARPIEISGMARMFIVFLLKRWYWLQLWISTVHMCIQYDISMWAAMQENRPL